MRRQSVEIQNSVNGQERGFVLVTMACAVIALIAVLGLSVDVGRMFIAKNETQAYCDAAALAAALALDGTTVGITNAKAAVTSSTNNWNLDTVKLTNPTVTFATAIGGPYVASPNPATGYIYARVAATVSEQLYFIPIVVPQTTQNVASTATAGQIDITSFPEGLAPYTAVSTNTTGPNFGLVVGQSYDLHWPNGTSGGGCDPILNPDACFLKPPCTGDSFASRSAVAQYWAATKGYWGSNSNNVIQQEIINLNSQMATLNVGTNIQPVLTNGNKASEAGYLDQRVNQDVNLADNVPGDATTPSTYLGDLHNGRRLLPVPIVDPTSTTSTTVSGYGQFLLLSNGVSDYYKKKSTGSDPFCAIYAGPYDVGSISPGVGGSTGATRVKLVQ